MRPDGMSLTRRARLVSRGSCPWLPGSGGSGGFPLCSDECGAVNPFRDPKREFIARVKSNSCSKYYIEMEVREKLELLLVVLVLTI